MIDKDIRFTQKRVDESWKEQIAKEQTPSKPVSRKSDKSEESSAPQNQTSKVFLQFVSSLAMQTLIHLGEIPHPATRMPEKNLEAAKEMIDILIELKKKTELGLSDEERNHFESLIPELQMKFSQGL